MAAAVQMVLPMAERVGWLRQGVGALIRQAGLRVMELLMEQEVWERVGERSQPQRERTANRWGKERGFCVVMGQKVPVQRPRVRTTDDQEVRLGSLRDVSPRRAADRNGVGETNARSEHQKIRPGGARVR